MFEGSFYIFLHFKWNAILPIGFDRSDPVPPDGNMSKFICHFPGSAKPDSPVNRFHLIRAKLTDPGVVFAAGKTGSLDEPRLFKNPSSLSESQSSSVFKEHKLFTEPES